MREHEWLAPLREKGEPLQSGETNGKFHRGFVEIVWMPASWFRHRAESLFDRVPVRELRVTRTTEVEFGKLMEYPLLGRTRRARPVRPGSRRRGGPDGGVEPVHAARCACCDSAAAASRMTAALELAGSGIRPPACGNWTSRTTRSAARGGRILRRDYGDAVRADEMERDRVTARPLIADPCLTDSKCCGNR